jgi:phosphoglycolate phosphatase
MDSTHFIASCILLACEDLGIATPSIQEAKQIIGLGLNDSMQQLFPDLPLERRMDVANAYRKHFLSRDHEIPLFPGIREMLHDIRVRHNFLAVATGKSRAGLERAFQSSGLKPFFDFSRCADEGFAKPHPEMLNKLMEFAGVQKERTLMIGDTTHDMQLAANAGVSAVAVSYGAHAHEELSASSALTCVTTVAALHEWLLQNG